MLLEGTDKSGGCFHGEVLRLQFFHHLAGLPYRFFLHPGSIRLDLGLFLQFLVLDLDGRSQELFLPSEFPVGPKVIGFLHRASGNEATVVRNESPLDGVRLDILHLPPDIGQLRLEFFH